MLSSATVESKEIKSSVNYSGSSLSAFIKTKKDKPAETVDALLAAFSSPDSRVAFALDELNEKERETFLDGLPEALQIYYGDLGRFFHLPSRDKETRVAVFVEEVLKRNASVPAQLLHAIKIRMAIFDHNQTLFWSLIKHSKEHVNLADFGFVDDHPPAHAREYDFSGLNLKRFTLCGQSLKLNLSGADLSGGQISCPHLDGSDFRGANLHLANLSGSCSYANFQGVDLTETKLFLHSPLQGADFRGAILTDEQKGHLKTYFSGFRELPKCYESLEDYLYKKTEHLVFADFKKVKFNYDFDHYVYAMLLTGAKTKKEFADIMKLVPEKLKTKKYWFFGTRTKTHSYWKVIENIYKTMPDIVSKPTSKTAELKKTEERIYYYVPSRLEDYSRDYHRKPMPPYLAEIIIKTITDTSFEDPSYKCIAEADVNHFIPSIALKNIRLQDETLDGIASQLRSYASLAQLHPTPKKIIQSIEALKAEFFIKQLQKNKLLLETPESKEPISSSTTTVLSELKSGDTALNKHPLFEEIFMQLDSKFKTRLDPHLQMMVMGLVRKDKAMTDERTIECRKACAEELLRIWEHKNVSCLSASSTEIAAQPQRLKDQVALFGFEVTKKEFEDDNGFHTAVYKQLEFFPELKAASETPDPGPIKFGSAHTKIQTQLADLMDMTILNKVMANYSGTHSISKDIYNSTWLDDLMIVALARGIHANIVILKSDGTAVQHIENATFPTCYFGFDGDNYYSLRRNPELEPTKSLPTMGTTRPLPSVSELKDSFFSWTAALTTSSAAPSTSSAPAKKM